MIERRCRVVYELPEEIERAARPIVEHFVPWIPHRIRELRMLYDHKEDGFDAWCEVLTPYGRAKISLCPPWLAMEQRERVSTYAHELAHLWLDPLNDSLHRDHAILLPDKQGELYRLARDRWKFALEQTVDELAELLVVAAGPMPEPSP